MLTPALRLSRLAVLALSFASYSALGAEQPARFASPLPDPLVAANGARVTTAEQWTKRRAEIVDLFATHVYGRAPIGRPERLRFDVTEKDAPAFEGAATRRVVSIAYSGPGGNGAIPLRLYFPAGGVKAKGVFVLIVNRDRAIINDAETKPMEFWPAKEIVARGYVAAAFHNSDAASDAKADSWNGGVFKIFGPSLEKRKADDWGTIAAWSWGASRAVDYLKSDPALAALPVAVVGHSRGGKAALWCGAQDERVDLTISNDSGCSGAALARRTRGETVERINTSFPHWFNGNYKTYNGREEALPLDQHMLIAAVAPRLAYVASASEDAHADPAAEFGACVAAEPVFTLFGRRPALGPRLPDPDTARHDGPIGYHLRAGKHDLKSFDWQKYMDFADRHLRQR